MANYRRATRLAALASVAALALAACSGGGSSSSPSTSASGATGFNAAVDGVVRPSTVTGGTLKLSATGDCDSWDPARTYYAWCWDMQRTFTRTLMGYAPKPGQAGDETIPDLATAAGAVSDNGLTYTYTLKDGIKYQDGTPITSKDIKYGIERLYATDVIYGGPGQYYWCLLDKCDANGAPKYQGPYKDKTGGLSQIETPDDKTIVFHLNYQFTDFDYLMTLPTSAPVPQSKDTGSKYTLNPVASGPFKFASYKPGKSLTLVRNDQWDQATDDIRHPLTDSITLTIISNPDDADQRLQNGDLDLEADGGVQQAFQSKIVTNPTLKANADNPVSGFIRYFSVAPSVPPLDNIHCRLAIFYAIDKSSLQRARGGTYGGDVAGSMAPLVVMGSDASYNPYPSGSDNTGDITKAKDELQQCGKPNGFDVKMAYVPIGRAVDVFTSAQQSLKRVGINVIAAPGEQASYYTTFLGSPSTVKKQGLGLGMAGWGPDFPTPYGFWYSIADGKAIRPEGNSNYPSLNDPKVNDAIAKSLTVTGSEKETVGADVNQAVMDSAVYLPFVFDKVLWYRNPRTTNLYLSYGLGNYYDYVNVGVGGSSS